VLEDHGYRVVAFGDPGAALEAVIGDPSSFDAVVTDVVMPTMSGPTLVERIAAIRRGCRPSSCPDTEEARCLSARHRHSPNPSAPRDITDAVGALLGGLP